MNRVVRVQSASRGSKSVPFLFSPSDDFQDIDSVLRSSFDISPDTNYKLFFLDPSPPRNQQQQQQQQQEKVFISAKQLANLDDSLKNRPIYIIADRSSPRIDTVDLDWAFLKRPDDSSNSSERAKDKEQEDQAKHKAYFFDRVVAASTNMFRHIRHQDKSIATNLMWGMPSYKDNFSIINLAMEVSAQLKTLAVYPEVLHVLEVTVTPTFGVLSSDGPTIDPKSHQWIMSCYRLKITRDSSNDKPNNKWAATSYEHSPTNEFKSVEVQKSSTWSVSSGVELSATPSGNLSLGYSKTKVATEQLEDFSTSFLCLPRTEFAEAHVEWQVELNRYKNEAYHPQDDNKLEIGGVPRSTMGIYRKQFMSSWLIRKNKNDLSDTDSLFSMNLRLDSSVTTRYSDLRGGEENNEAWCWDPTDDGFVRLFSPMNPPTRPSRVKFLQSRGLALALDLNNVVIPSMELKKMEKKEIENHSDLLATDFFRYGAMKSQATTYSNPPPGQQGNANSNQNANSNPKRNKQQKRQTSTPTPDTTSASNTNNTAPSVPSAPTAVSTPTHPTSRAAATVGVPAAPAGALVSTPASAPASVPSAPAPVSASTSTPVSTPVSAPSNAPRVRTGRNARNAIRDTPREAPNDAPRNSPRDAPRNSPRDAARNSPRNSPQVAPQDAGAIAPSSGPASTPPDAPRNATAAAAGASVPQHASTSAPNNPTSEVRSKRYSQNRFYRAKGSEGTN